MPRNNKRKRGAASTPVVSEELSPIVFLARGIRADTQLTVFRQELTRLADHYCALPVVSGTLTGALLRSPMFGKIENRDGGEVCECQDKCPANFATEHFFLTTAKWDCLPSGQVELIKGDRELYNLVRLKLGALHTAISKAQHGLLAPLLNGEGLFCDLTGREGTARLDDNDVLGSVSSFKEIHDYAGENESTSSLYDDHSKSRASSILPVLKNNLALDWTGDGPGEGVYKRSFLCTDLEDDEYPWDLEEILDRLVEVTQETIFGGRNLLRD
ncbi:hypothetical protein NHQ30_009573 [Ciborinia camelliae]|nr:hypothetical protein NHQ30_009573 [Ciborinia camelliae]